MHWFENLFNFPLELYRERQFLFAGRIPAQFLVLIFLKLVTITWLAVGVKYQLSDREIIFPRLAFSTTGGTHKFWAIDKSMEAIKMDANIIICFLSH